MNTAFQNLNGLVTPDNWTFCHYKLNEKRSSISIGADTKSDEFIYFVSVLDSEDRDIFQKEFSDLNVACQYINQNYNDWSFVNQLKNDDGGCSTCSAH